MSDKGWLDLSEVFGELETGELTIRGREVRVHAVLCAEREAVLRQIPDPIPPQKPINASGEIGPNLKAPAYMAAVEERMLLIQGALCGIAIRLRGPDGEWSIDRDEAWVRAYASFVLSGATSNEVSRISEMSESLGRGEPVGKPTAPGDAGG